MKKIKVSVILLNKKGHILLQLRDEEPEKGKWVPFGGSVEEGETEEEALRREIKEELSYDIKKPRFFKQYELGGVSQPIYIVKEEIDIKDLKLGEGEEMKFFKPDEIQNLDIGFNYKEIILDFLTSLL